MPMTAVSDRERLKQAVALVEAACLDAEVLSEAGLTFTPPKIEKGYRGWEGFHTFHIGATGTKEVKFSFATEPSPQELVNFNRLGLIAEDEHGGLHLMHQDRIETGAGQDSGEIFDLLWEGPEPMSVTGAEGHVRKPRRWIRGARLNGGREVFLEEMVSFLGYWESMRAAVRQPPTEPEEGAHLSMGRPGRRRSAFMSRTPASSTVVDPIHDLMVDRVERELRKRGHETDHNSEIDLMAFDASGRVTHLVEVKPSGARDSVYKGVGQLMVNGRALLVESGQPKPAPGMLSVLVVGEDIKGPMASLVRGLGVRVVRVYVAPGGKDISLIDDVP